MSGTCSTYGVEKRKVLVGRLEGKRPLSRHRRKLGDNIKVDFKKWNGTMN